MLRTSDYVHVTFTGLSEAPETHVIPQKIAKKLLKEAVAHEKNDNDGVPLSEVFPELYDERRASTLLKGARYRAELTQQQLAALVGIKQHHLSEMENGKRPIGKTLAKKLSKALGAPYQYFL